jgi:hypothetical protein
MTDNHHVWEGYATPWVVVRDWASTRMDRADVERGMKWVDAVEENLFSKHRKRAQAALKRFIATSPKADFYDLVFATYQYAVKQHAL